MKAIVVAPLLLVAAIAVILVPSASAMSKCQKCYLTTPATLRQRFVCGRRLFTLNRAQLIGDFENGEDAQLIGDFEDDEDRVVVQMDDVLYEEELFEYKMHQNRQSAGLTCAWYSWVWGLVDDRLTDRVF